MTPEDARKLIGGYATGSLSESEKRALFEAALNDQDLFNELAREQGLKEVIDSPGAKQRLIAALQPARPSRGFAPAWLWTAAAVTALAVAVTTWQFLHTSKAPAEVAQVAEKKSEQKSQPAPVEPAPKPIQPRARGKQPAPAKSVPPRPGAAGQIASEKQPVATLDQPVQAPAAAPPPPPASAIRRAQPQPLFALRQRFSFEYSLEPDDLVLKFNAAGWLYLHFSPGADTIEHARISAGEVRREPIPNNATEATIIFTAGPQTDPALGVQLTRSGKSGTVEDPSGNRIELLFRFY